MLAQMPSKEMLVFCMMTAVLRVAPLGGDTTEAHLDDEHL